MENFQSFIANANCDLNPSTALLGIGMALP